MKEKQRHQEERLRAALERAVAQPKKKVCGLLSIGPATCERFSGIQTNYLIRLTDPGYTSVKFFRLTASIGSQLLSLVPCDFQNN